MAKGNSALLAYIVAPKPSIKDTRLVCLPDGGGGGFTVKAESGDSAVSGVSHDARKQISGLSFVEDYKGLSYTSS